MNFFKKSIRKFYAVVMSGMMVLSGFAGLDLYQVQASTYSEMSALDAYAYSGDDLGATYSKTSTTFKVWAPTASSVKLKRYKTGSDSESGAGVIGTTNMTSQSQGIWSVTISGDLAGTYYTYLVTVSGTTYETNDIYAKTTGVNGQRAMVIDLDSTDPEGWSSDHRVTCENQTDAIIWEAHVRDFSASSDSGMTNKGKFLAFTETGTTVNNDGVNPTGVDYLKELGITHVHLLPVFDYATVDETSLDTDQFNWGYDPLNYNVPEGSYSTNPYDGNVRVNEFKQMVQSLHNQGIGVVMDVVYNHTSAGSGKTNNWFDRTVPGYYYRQNSDGTYSNASGCGNETASDRAMYRKYMIDSVVYWATEYHIDGFRFDLMGIHDVATMNAIRAALDEVDPNIIIYGEPWTAASTTCPSATAVQSNMSQVDSRIAAFNDKSRDAIKGSCFDASSSGFIQGASGFETALKGSIQANSTSMSGSNQWSKQPSQTVTYTSAHDNYTLYDKLVKSVKGGSGYSTRYEDLVAMNKMAGAIILTSQGMSFFQAGEEFARTKYGDENSYASATSVNQLVWSNTKTYSDIVDYYAGLIDIREAYSPFRDPSNTSNNTIYFSWATSGFPSNVVAFTMYNTLATDEWNFVAVLHNSNSYATTVNLMTYDGVSLPTNWVIVANGSSAGTTSLGTISGTSVTIPARTSMVLVDKTSFDSTVIANKGTVTVNHMVDGSTYSTQTLTGKVGTSYTTSPLSELTNLGYTVSSVSGNTTGTYSTTGATVTYTYTYDPSKIGKVTINYENEDGVAIATSETKTGLVGSSYTISPKTISGYTTSDSAVTGTYSTTEATITFTYSEVDTSKVYLINAANYSTPYVYTWNNASQAASVAWPGTKMTLVDLNSKLYSFEITDENADMIIFNNGSGGTGNQTADLTIPTDGKNCYNNSTGVWTTYDPTVHVTSVSLDKTSATLDVGDTTTLTATVAPSNATNTKVTWTSSNTSVATVSSAGVVTALAPGSATITAITKDGSYKATCAVTVNSNVVEPIVNTSFISQEAVVGQKIVFKGSATGGSGEYQYAYYYRKTSDKTWTTAGTEWGTSAYATAKPGTNTVYEVCIKVRDANDTSNVVKKYLSFAANTSETSLKCYGSVYKTIYKYGTTNKITASSAGNSGTVKYKYEYRKASSWTYETIKDYTTATNVSWDAPQTGSFTLRITAYDGTDYAIRTINIKVKK